MPGKNKLTQEEEILLQDFSRTVSKKSQALFYGNALMVAVLPLCKYNLCLFDKASIMIFS